MNDQIESLAVQKQIGDDIRIMFHSSAGWLATRDIIEEMRREAFCEWGELKLNAPTEEIISIRAKEQVLKDLLERLEGAVKKGDEAGILMSQSESESRAEHKFKAEKLTTDIEIDRLRAPLKSSWFEKILAR
jgi:hypothetical protein